MPKKLPLLLIAMLLQLGCSEQQSAAPEAKTKPERTPTAANTETKPYSVFNDHAKKAAEMITGDEIKATIAEIASDAYEGRGPGSTGDKEARDYLAAQLESIGYAPGAADGSWEQSFDLVGINASQPAQWQFSTSEQSLDLKQGGEFIVGSGVQNEQSTVSDAELVFVGYGIEAPEYGWNDFKGQDLTGKVLVMLNNDPDWDEALFAGNRRLYYGRWSYKYESAARQGAAGAIIIHTTPSAGYPWQVVQTSWTGAQFELPAADEPRLQIAAWVTEDAAKSLVSLAGQDLAALVESARSVDFSPVSLGVSTSIEFSNEITKVQSANVLGVLEGSDPELSKEAVIFTAHHDHIGVGLPNFSGDPEDRIYNGARDNASGIAMILNIAKALAGMPERPRRSILVAFVAAEEQGLLGSKYYAQYPTFAPGRLAANVNFDSGNIWGVTRDITFVGKGKSSLDEVADQVAGYQQRIVKPDQFPDKGYFYRSDQFSLARIGVPALYIGGGTEFIGRPEGWGEEQIGAYTAVNYHQPSDELTDDWNFDGMVKDAQFGFWAGLISANSDEMQSWNIGDEFEAARKKALAELN